MTDLHRLAKAYVEAKEARMGCTYPDEKFYYYVYADRGHDGEPLWEMGKGKTRAEAVARAFVEVFGSDGNRLRESE